MEGGYSNAQFHAQLSVPYSTPLNNKPRLGARVPAATRLLFVALCSNSDKCFFTDERGLLGQQALIVDLREESSGDGWRIILEGVPLDFVGAHRRMKATRVVNLVRTW